MREKKCWMTVLIIVLAILFTSMLVHILHINMQKQNDSIEYDNLQLYDLKTDNPFSFQKELDKIMVLIKPDCPYCGEFAESIIKSEYGLETFEILFISSEHPDSILHFSLNHYSEKITYLCDETNLFSKELRVKKYPTIFIYSGKSQKITKRFVGAVPFVQIRQEFSNE